MCTITWKVCGAVPSSYMRTITQAELLKTQGKCACNFPSCSQDVGKPVLLGLRVQRERGEHRPGYMTPGLGRPGHPREDVEYLL